MIHRDILKEARTALKQFRALCVTGPRQSGKTTLSKLLLKGKPYVNFEDPSTEAEFLSDPKGFLQKFSNGAVLDEVQCVPDIFRYIQVLNDCKSIRRQFTVRQFNLFMCLYFLDCLLKGRLFFDTFSIPFSMST
ncbi:MAG: AAA family ATPase [Bacteroidota bacterium]